MGGAEYRCKLALEYLLDKNAFEIYYVCRNLDPNFKPNGYEVVKFGNRFSRYGIYFDGFSLYKALRKIKPHIIYQNAGSGDTGLAAIYSKIHGAKLVHQICNDNSLKRYKNTRLKTRIKRFLTSFLLDYGMKRADVIIGQSEGQDKLLKKRYGRSCDAIIPLGHPIPHNKIEKTNDIRVLWIANFKYHQKQPELFVELANRMRHKKMVTFIMIGMSIGRKDDFYKLMEKIKKTPNLKYLGQISQSEVNMHLRKSHILVNTSRYEGFPNTFVQAWLSGVPVVSLNVDPDGIISREKIGYHSEKFEDLLNDVDTLITKRSVRENMGKRAMIYAKKKHSIEDMAGNIVNIFDSLTSNQNNKI